MQARWKATTEQQEEEGWCSREPAQEGKVAAVKQRSVQRAARRTTRRRSCLDVVGL